MELTRDSRSRTFSVSQLPQVPTHDINIPSADTDEHGNLFEFVSTPKSIDVSHQVAHSAPSIEDIVQLNELPPSYDDLFGYSSISQDLSHSSETKQLSDGFELLKPSNISNSSKEDLLIDTELIEDTSQLDPFSPAYPTFTDSTFPVHSNTITTNTTTSSIQFDQFPTFSSHISTTIPSSSVLSTVPSSSNIKPTTTTTTTNSTYHSTSNTNILLPPSYNATSEERKEVIVTNESNIVEEIEEENDPYDRQANQDPSAWHQLDTPTGQPYWVNAMTAKITFNKPKCLVTSTSSTTTTSPPLRVTSSVQNTNHHTVDLLNITQDSSSSSSSSTTHHTSPSRVPTTITTHANSTTSTNNRNNTNTTTTTTTTNAHNGIRINTSYDSNLSTISENIQLPPTTSATATTITDTLIDMTSSSNQHSTSLTRPSSMNRPSSGVPPSTSISGMPRSASMNQHMNTASIMTTTTSSTTTTTMAGSMTDSILIVDAVPVETSVFSPPTFSSIRSDTNVNTASSSSSTTNSPAFIGFINRTLYGEDIRRTLNNTQVTTQNDGVRSTNTTPVSTHSRTDNSISVPRMNSNVSLSTISSHESPTRRRGTHTIEQIQNYLNDTSKIKRRQLLHYEIIEVPPSASSSQTGVMYDIYITLKQPKLITGKKSPQGKRPNTILVGKTSSRARAELICQRLAPPTWAGENDPQICIICHYTFGLLRPGHHCRNCGYWVCTKCSSKSWPSTMLPSTYHDQEQLVRVCESCNVLMERFNDALRHGQHDIAKILYETGNINMHTPLTVYVTAEYPIHCAVQGGNMQTVKWLLEEHGVPICDRHENALLTAAGHSVLAIAAMYGHGEIMEYLVQIHGCKVIEIEDAKILQHAMHVLLKASGTYPKLVLKTINSSGWGDKPKFIVVEENALLGGNSSSSTKERDISGNNSATSSSRGGSSHSRINSRHNSITSPNTNTTTTTSGHLRDSYSSTQDNNNNNDDESSMRDYIPTAEANLATGVLYDVMEAEVSFGLPPNTSPTPPTSSTTSPEYRMKPPKGRPELIRPAQQRLESSTLGRQLTTRAIEELLEESLSTPYTMNNNNSSSNSSSNTIELLPLSTMTTSPNHIIRPSSIGSTTPEIYAQPINTNPTTMNTTTNNMRFSR